MKLKEEDIITERGHWITLTHKPSGLVVQDHGAVLKELYKVLRENLKDLVKVVE